MNIECEVYSYYLGIISLFFPLFFYFFYYYIMFYSFYIYSISSSSYNYCSTYLLWKFAKYSLSKSISVISYSKLVQNNYTHYLALPLVITNSIFVAMALFLYILLIYAIYCKSFMQWSCSGVIFSML